MMKRADYTINVRGELLDLSQPQVMGILNATPDSFYSSSRKQTEQEIERQVGEMLAQGASVIDVGACSTRPNAEWASEEDERKRLESALKIISRTYPDALLSVDTFRPDIAKMAVEEYGVAIINDVSGGENPARSGKPSGMFQVANRLRVPYVLTSWKSNVRDMLMELSAKVQQLRDLGMCDIIVDPGYGFGKDFLQNYNVLANQEKLLALELPLLVGVSRKSMLCRLLGIDAKHALNATTAINMAALQGGASVLRVHDVREAVECVKLYDKLCSSVSV